MAGFSLLTASWTIIHHLVCITVDIYLTHHVLVKVFLIGENPEHAYIVLLGLSGYENWSFCPYLQVDKTTLSCLMIAFINFVGLWLMICWTYKRNFSTFYNIWDMLSIILIVLRNEIGNLNSNPGLEMFVLIPLRRVGSLFSLQLWVNSKADLALWSWLGNQSRKRKILNLNQ